MKATATAHAICDALVAQSRRDIAKAHAEAAARPIGQIRLDINFYSKADSKRPVEDYDFHAHGRHYKGFGARWAVFKVKWDGREWKKVRKLTGPMKFVDVLDAITAECKRLGLERAP